MSGAPTTALGIDIGGTKIAAGVVSFPRGDVLAERSVPSLPERGSKAILNEIADLAEALSEEVSSSGHSVSGVGVGLCELVSPTGRILSHNCLPFDETELKTHLATFAPVVVEADVRAAARAEALFGAGREYRIFLYVTVGTGIASCLMLDGSPYLGARGATGTMASSPLSMVCEHCGELSQQTLEQVSSGPALVARYNRVKPGGARTGQDVLAAAAKGEVEALRVVHSGGEALESTIGLLVNVLDPEAVIIGGGLGLSQGSFWDSFVASTRRHIWSEVHRDLPFLRAATGVRAGFIGAAASVWKKCTVKP